MTTLSGQDIWDCLERNNIDRGHEQNNRQTAWINAVLYRLKPTVDENGMDGFEVEKVGSSMDKMAELRET